MRKAYDYVVAGAGSAGCVLAARLAESGDASVLLVEAGGNARSLFVDMPAGNGFLFGNPRYDWGFTSVAQPGLGGRVVHYPRGKGLGGSSILNGMIYVRGNPLDFDRWRSLGLPGWGYDDLLPYFLRAQRSLQRTTPWHGRAGPLRTGPADNFTPLDRLFVQAAMAAGHPLNDDFNGPTQTGVGRVDLTVSGGNRQSAARAYLRRRPRNLDVATATRVTGVAMRHGRATGLKLLGSGGAFEVSATREVILCLGTFGSPHALMVSGLGPAAHLRAHGIPVIADLPGVGSHLADHINVPVQFACLDPDLSFARYQRLDRALWLGARWLFARRGPAASPFWSTCLFDGFDGSDVPALQVFFTPMVVTEAGDGGAGDEAGRLERWGRKVFVRGTKKALAGFQFDINQMHPQALGEVRLVSPDPLVAPSIDPRFLGAQRELSELVVGVRQVRAIVRQAAFDQIRGPELSPGAAEASDAEIEAAIRRVATTGHHPVGTCRMGVDEDPSAVVDAQLRVRGVEGLRVCDASIFPDQITGNPNAAIMAIAEKAADMVLGRHGGKA